MPGNWIKIHRKMVDHWVFKNPDVLKVWLYCLLKARWDDGEFKFSSSSSVIKLKRGEFVTGRASLHKACFPEIKQQGTSIIKRPSASTTWRILKSLEECGMLDMKVNSQYTIVSVCKYDKYQDVPEEDEQVVEPRMNSGRTADEQPVNTKKKLKEGEEEKKVKKKQTAEKVEIPKALNTLDFAMAWKGWLAFRVEVKKPSTPRSQKMMLKQLEEMGAGRAIAAIEYSIANGWTGIFEENSRKGRKNETGGRYDAKSEPSTF